MEPINITKSTFYDERLKTGNEFEKFMVRYLNGKGRNIKLYNTEHEQITIGETDAGIEFKNDSKFRKTGNLFIETKERRHISKEYVDSGIYRKDNTETLIIGDTVIAYEIPILKLREIDSHCPQRENDTKTGKGFLLNIELAKQKEIITNEYHPWEDILQKNMVRTAGWCVK